MPSRNEHNHQPFSRTHLHSRKYKKLSSTMEGPNPGPMDPPGGGRIPDRILISAPSRQRLSNVQDGQTSTGGLGSRDSGSLKQRSSRKRRIWRTWLRQSDVCSPQEGRQVETNYQLKIPQPVRGETPLQDGRHKKFERYPSRRRPDGQTGLEGCVFFHINRRKTSKIPAVLLEEPTTPIHLPTLRTEQRTLRVHETTPSCSYLSEGQGNPLSDVSRRHADTGENCHGAESQLCTRETSPDLAGVPCQRRQISSGSNTGVRIPGIFNQFQENDTGSNRRENKISDLTVQNLDGVTSDHNSTACSNHRRHDINDSSCTSSTSPLPGTTRAEKHSLGPPPLIFCPDYTDTGSKTGFDVVEDISETVEISEYPTEESFSDAGIGCFRFGLGSSISQSENINRRCLEYTRDNPPHQLQGAFCSLAGAPVLCFNPTGCTHTSSDRQHSSSGLCEQNGRSAFQEPVSTSITGLGLVSLQEPYDFSRAPSRLTEPTGRQGIENRFRLFRMGTGHPDLPQTDGDEGPMYGGSLCIPSVSQTSNILQLENGSRSESSGCSNTVVEQHQRLCLPSILSNRQVSSQNQIREGTLGIIDHTLMEITNLVSSTPRNVSGTSNCTPERQLLTNGSTRESSSNDSTRSSTVSRLDCIRNSLQSRGLSDKAISLMCASWRSNTESSYSSSWRIWERWCLSEGVNPLCATIENVLEFLTDQFHQGKKYSTLNIYRSAISTTHTPVDGFQVGKHPLVSRLMKGAFNLRPPKPRHAGRWDVKQVLDFLKQKGPTADLSVKDLTLKLSMLLALSNADRASDLCALDVRYLSLTPKGAEFQLVTLTKSARPDRHFISFYPSFQDETVCPVTTLQLYLTRTADWRADQNRNQLFLSINRPHHPVTPATVARWLKETLRMAGVSTDFTAHSTRATAVSVAFDKGVSIKDILNTADLTSDSVFKKYYYKSLTSSVNQSTFSHAVLQA